MDFDDSALDMGQPAPKAAPKTAPKTAPKSTGGSKPAPKDAPKTAGDTKPAPKTESRKGPTTLRTVGPSKATGKEAEAKSAAAKLQAKGLQRDQAIVLGREAAGIRVGSEAPPPLPPVSAQTRNRQFLGDRAAARKEWEARNASFKKPDGTYEDPWAYYSEKLAKVESLRKSRDLGPRSDMMRALVVQEYVPPTPGEELSGVTPLSLTPKEGRSRGLYPTEVVVPTEGRGNALDSVGDFRRKAEELGLKYGAARRAWVQGDEALRSALADPNTLKSDRPRLAAEQQARSQALVNARESLRQFGFVGDESTAAEKEMNTRFAQ